MCRNRPLTKKTNNMLTNKGIANKGIAVSRIIVADYVPQQTSY